MSKISIAKPAQNQPKLITNIIGLVKSYEMIYQLKVKLHLGRDASYGAV